MSKNDWRCFLVTPHYVADLNGNEYVYYLPPSWKNELRIVEILERSANIEVKDLNDILSSAATLLEIVALILDIRDANIVEQLFDIETIEAVFRNVWSYIAEDSVDTDENNKVASSSNINYGLTESLAMFACECGWTPEQVLSLPRMQVLKLAKAIANYTGNRMRFFAAIHGCPLDDTDDFSSGGVDESDIEKQAQQFLNKGLNIEVV